MNSNKSLVEKAHKAIEASNPGYLRHTTYAEFRNERNQIVRVVDCYYSTDNTTIALQDTDFCVCGIKIF